MAIGKRFLAELIGMFWLVFGGCCSAVLAAGFPGLGIGFVGVSLAFSLTVLTMAYAIGHISGCHLNPAVTVGLTVGGRFPAREIPHYVAAQVVGAIVAAAALYAVASGQAGFDLTDGFASDGYGAHSPGGYSLTAILMAEVVLTFIRQSRAEYRTRAVRGWLSPRSALAFLAGSDRGCGPGRLGVSVALETLGGARA